MIRPECDKSLVPINHRLVGAAAHLPVFVVHEDDEILESCRGLLLTAIQQRFKVAVIACDGSGHMAGVACEVVTVYRVRTGIGHNGRAAALVAVSAFGIQCGRRKHAVVLVAVAVDLLPAMTIGADHSRLHVYVSYFKLSFLVDASVAAAAHVSLIGDRIIYTRFAVAFAASSVRRGRVNMAVPASGFRVVYPE